ncbi:MAG TPA: hypothetical protein GXZ20_05155 [Halanaerobiaceae bacterium]|nr:hypothetical protein [Halanaerobiaceae bacterium]
MIEGFGLVIFFAIICFLITMFSEKTRLTLRYIFIFIGIIILAVIMIMLLSVFPPLAAGAAYPMWYLLRHLLRKLYPDKHIKS